MSTRTAFLAAALGGLLLLLLFAPDADAGTYTVRECHHSAPQNDFSEGIAEASPSPGPYGISAGAAICGNAAAEYALRIAPQSTALNGQSGSIRFVAPDGTRLTGVALDARLRSEKGHRARLSMANAAGIERKRFAIGPAGPADFAPYSWTAPGPAGALDQFVAGLTCDNPGFDCPATDEGAKAETAIRNIRLTLRDNVAPTVDLTGALVSGGWIKGETALERKAMDVGGGLTYAPVTVNGTGVSGLSFFPCTSIPGTNDAARLVPCPVRHDSSVDLDTTSGPFQDGANRLVACASDFGSAANVSCVERVVQVDNTAPALYFRNQSLEDPELIRVTVADATSGVSAESGRVEYRQVGSLDWKPLASVLEDGELVARVDSVSEPAGDYEFRASIEDVAGNVGSTTLREGGEPMTLTFPLKDPVRIEAQLGNGATDQLVPFRSEGEVSGRLVDTAGRPIPNQEVQVTETFAEGSLIDRRVRAVVTNANGKYRSLLPGGPSRDVQVEFPGSRKYLDDQIGGLDFDVRGAATFDTSKRRVKAGSSVAFLGRVKRYYAQIPKGGKLVEVQVKSGNDWITLKEATGTDAKGRVEISHRFRRFYTQRVTFTFRLKVTPENGWPYRGATTTARRKVTVVPR